MKVKTLNGKLLRVKLENHRKSEKLTLTSGERGSPVIGMFHSLFIVLKIPLFSMPSSHD